MTKASGTPLVLLAAGGTGGHLFPAEALAAALEKRGVTVDLATDHRAERYGSRFPARETHIIPSDTVRARNPIALARTALALGRGLIRAYCVLRRIKPAAVVGFGGYPTLPPVGAATVLKIPTVIHEQNAVMGRANRQLAAHVTAIATSFDGVLDAEPALAAKATRTGNPVRPAAIAAAATPFVAPEADGLVRLLVFGGSQGARIMSEIVPSAIEQLDASLRTRLLLAQQARDEDLAARARHLWPAAHRLGSLAVLPRSAGAHRGRASGRSRAPARRRCRSLPPSAGPRSWCRCRARSIRISSPMPACSPLPAARSVCRRATSRRRALPPRSPRSPPARNASPRWRRPRARRARPTPPTGSPIW